MSKSGAAGEVGGTSGQKTQLNFCKKNTTDESGGGVTMFTYGCFQK